MPISEGFSWTEKLIKLHFFYQKSATAKVNSRENSKYDQFAKINTCEKSKFLQFAKIITHEIQFFLTRENKYPSAENTVFVDVSEHVVLLSGHKIDVKEDITL